MATPIFQGGATKTACAGTFTVIRNELPASVFVTGLCSSDCDVVLQRIPQCIAVGCTGYTQYAACAVVNFRKTGWTTRPLDVPGIYKINKPCVSCASVQAWLSKGDIKESI